MTGFEGRVPGIIREGETRSCKTKHKTAVNSSLFGLLAAAAGLLLLGNWELRKIRGRLRVHLDSVFRCQGFSVDVVVVGSFGFDDDQNVDSQLLLLVNEEE